ILIMAPPPEVPTKASGVQISHPPLNERIISSMSRRSVAAHPWHDLEIGTQSHNFFFMWPWCPYNIQLYKKNENKDVAVDDFLPASSAYKAIQHSM
ncbi:hypothetical protein GW17_00013183, partial [Ensete ventricosum]